MTQAMSVAPADWPGSLPEFLVFRELLRRGLREGSDFVYQSPFMGGRIQRGGVVIDFLFTEPPGLAINVQGVYWHYGLGVETRARDILARAQLAGEGITLILIDEDDILQDVRYIVGEALQSRDHSRLTRGG